MYKYSPNKHLSYYMNKIMEKKKTDKLTRCTNNFIKFVIIIIIQYIKYFIAQPIILNCKIQ